MVSVEEYSTKYGFDIVKYRKDEKYQKTHQKQVSGEAQAFLSWHDF
jgi:hypothetical protein